MRTIITPAPIGLDMSWFDKGLYDPIKASYNPAPTITWEPEITAVRSPYSSEVYYTRRWKPTDGVEHLSPDQFVQQGEMVMRHAERQGMPSSWVEMTPHTSYGPRNLGEECRIYFDSMARDALIGQQHIYASSPLTADTFRSMYEGVYMSNAGAWKAWSSTSGTSASSTGTYTVSTDSTTSSGAGAWYVIPAGVPAYGNRPSLTQEQLAEQEQRMVAQREQRAAFARDKKEAVKKAEKLLLSLLSEKQKKEYADKKSVTVVLDNREFTIKHKWSGNLFERNLKTGEKKRWCAIPLGIDIPIADQMAGQMLHLATNPDALLKLANPVRVM